MIKKSDDQIKRKKITSREGARVCFLKIYFFQFNLGVHIKEKLDKLKHSAD